MDFQQATITKLDNGFVVALQGYSELKGEKIGQHIIAKDLDEVIEFLVPSKKLKLV